MLCWIETLAKCSTVKYWVTQLKVRAGGTSHQTWNANFKVCVSRHVLFQAIERGWDLVWFFRVVFFPAHQSNQKSYSRLSKFCSHIFLLNELTVTRAMLPCGSHTSEAHVWCWLGFPFRCHSIIDGETGMLGIVKILLFIYTWHFQ